MASQLRNNWTKIAGKAKKVQFHTNSTIKKTIMATLVITTISANGAIASAKETKKLETIYHVYIDNQYLGTVSNKDKVEELLDNKVSQIKEQYKDFNLQYTSDNYTLVPEQVFRTTANNEENVLNLLDSQYRIHVEAVALKINGETVTYLENEKAVAEVIEKLKQKYVSAEELAQMEQQKKSKDKPAKLKPGESRLLDIQFSETVSVGLEEVDPSKVLSADDAIKLLQKGTLTEEKYKVKEGDVLGSIAEAHGLKLKQLLELNPGYNEDSLLQIGDKLNVTVYKPYLNVIIKKEVTKSEEIPYQTEVIEDSKMYKGDSKVVQEGKNGSKNITYISSQKMEKRLTGKSLKKL